MILTAMLHSLLEFGYDPRNVLQTIKRAIQQNIEQSINDEVCDFTLVTMSQIIHLIAPFYLSHALDVVTVKSISKLFKILIDLIDVHSNLM